MKLLRWFFFLLVLLVVVYLLGPAPDKPVYSAQLPVVPQNADSLEAYIRTQESLHKVKPENEARVVWQDDSSRKRTPYAVVYLHGFSASQEEGDPVHTNFAKKFGFNLYLSRLAGHGIDTTDPFAELTADQYWGTAKQALAIGEKLGARPGKGESGPSYWAN